MTDSFPKLWARTRRWTLGQPRSIEVVGGGDRILFLRSLAGDDPRTALWCVDVGPNGLAPERMLIDPLGLGPEVDLSDAERARRERVRETAAGVVSFSVDDGGRRAVALVSGRLLVVNVDSGDVQEVPAPDDVYDARIDPTGQRIAACRGSALCVVDIASGRLRVVAAPADGEPAVFWGRAEHVGAEEMDRPRGHWWSPDGKAVLSLRVDESAVQTWWISDPANPARSPRPIRYPPVGGVNADVSLWRLDGIDVDEEEPTATEIRWDRAAYEYLPRVLWARSRGPILAVQNRQQTCVRYFEAAADGTTSEIARDEQSPWVELHPGSPAVLESRLVRIADVDGHRRLLIDDQPTSPGSLHLRAIAGTTSAGVVVIATADDPAATQVHFVALDGATTLLSEPAGVHTAEVSGDICVITAATLSRSGQATVVLRAGQRVGELASVALAMPFEPVVDRFVTASGVRVGLVLPRHHRAGTALPVLMDPYGGPGAQRVVDSGRAWLESQWWADQGFAVVVADGPGTPGGPVSWEHGVAGDLAGPAVQAQVDALAAAAARNPDLDTARVAIRGWSFGGFLAALAVLRRPEVFHAGVAGAPVTDMRLYDTHYTERYLGTDPTSASYAANCLLEEAAALSRPLMLIHGFADDNVVVAHTLQFSQRLTEAGRPHTVLPLCGVTHMTPQEEVAENLLLLQRDFLTDALSKR